MTDFQPTPQTPEQVDEGLRDAMKQAIKDGVIDATSYPKQMTERVKFTYITRTIDPKSRIHYLDAISDKGEHYTAQMETGVEKWITWKETWRKSPQMPYDT